MENYLLDFATYGMKLRQGERKKGEEEYTYGRYLLPGLSNTYYLRSKTQVSPSESLLLPLSLLVSLSITNKTYLQNKKQNLQPCLK